MRVSEAEALPEPGSIGKLGVSNVTVDQQQADMSSINSAPYLSDMKPPNICVSGYPHKNEPRTRPCKI